VTRATVGKTRTPHTKHAHALSLVDRDRQNSRLDRYYLALLSDGRQADCVVALSKPSQLSAEPYRCLGTDCSCCYSSRVRWSCPCALHCFHFSRLRVEGGTRKRHAHSRVSWPPPRQSNSCLGRHHGDTAQLPPSSEPGAALHSMERPLPDTLEHSQHRRAVAAAAAAAGNSCISFLWHAPGYSTLPFSTRRRRRRGGGGGRGGRGGGGWQVFQAHSCIHPDGVFARAACLFQHRVSHFHVRAQTSSLRVAQLRGTRVSDSSVALLSLHHFSRRANITRHSKARHRPAQIFTVSGGHVQ